MPAPAVATFLRRLIGSVILLAVLAATAWFLQRWKGEQNQAMAAAAAAMPEPAEVVEAASVTMRSYTRTTTAIGTVRARQSITLRNELPGTVRVEHLETGKVVEANELLVEQDVAVEQAQLQALEAEAVLAESMLGRMTRALEQQGASEADVDRAKAQRDMSVAAVKRLEAVVEQKRLRAPFRARTGLVDLHVGQYLEPGTPITTLVGVDDAVHIDFAVTQEVAARVNPGQSIEVVVVNGHPPVPATVLAIDAEVDTDTRSATIRALLRGVEPLPQPGASVRVRVPVTAPSEVTVVPVSALRRGPDGDSVFVLTKDPAGNLRSQARRVDSGAVLGDVVVVDSGIAVGELIATVGSFKLREGALVQIASATPKSN
ncbi:MAG: efflux RND transporter periplasmic adaptor subunit [Planctomycetota bacterium]